MTTRQRGVAVSIGVSKFTVAAPPDVIDARPPRPTLKLYANSSLGHDGPFHGLNPQEAARNHR
jgi:hypothetical protein